MIVASGLQQCLVNGDSIDAVDVKKMESSSSLSRDYRGVPPITREPITVQVARGPSSPGSTPPSADRGDQCGVRAKRCRW